MEFQEISTEELSNLFATTGGMFEGEEGFQEAKQSKQAKEESMDGLAFTDETDDEGQSFTYDPELDVEEDFDDITDGEEALQDAEEFEEDKLYSIGGKNYEVGQIEKAVSAYRDINEYQKMVDEHKANLDIAAEEFNKMQSLAYGQIDATLDYWRQVAEHPSTNDNQYREAMREIRNCESQKKEIEQQYAKSVEVMNQRKAEAERMKGITIRNELVHSHGWNQDDFQAATDYIKANQIVVKGDAVNTQLMIALRKAAEYDAKRSKTHQESEQKVVKALRHKSTPVPSVAPQNGGDKELAKRKAAAKAAKGELSQSDMFRFLED
ncbi:TPA: hypothetical protein NOU44_000243 [Salmonella enterica subsp. enterica serovar Infantis]|nr:hypothetical protein [Salmonella enterica subsp. enterica serovar Infantis]